MKPPCMDCGLPHRARHFAQGRCSTCYQRYRLTPEWQPSPRRRRTTEDRLAWYVTSDQGCHLYQGYVSRAGYASAGSKKLHREAYEAANGPIPRGLTIDHTCHNVDLTCPGGDTCLHRRCINPDHLEAVTLLVNTRRAPRNFATINRLKTECVRGHPFTPENTIRRSDGYRECRACAIENRQRAQAKRPKSPRVLSAYCLHGHEYTPENTRMKTRKRNGQIQTVRLCVTCKNATARLSAQRCRERAA